MAFGRVFLGGCRGAVALRSDVSLLECLGLALALSNPDAWSAAWGLHPARPPEQLRVKPHRTTSAGSIFATLLSPCSCDTKSKAASLPGMTSVPYKPNPFLEKTKIPLPCTSICLANSLT